MQLADRYEILETLATGPTAVVLLARRRSDGKLVALKEFLWLTTEDEASRARFERTAEIARTLDHPNVVTVLETFEDGLTPYLAMEYAERGSLRLFVGTLTLAQVLGVLADTLAALGHAAAHGIVHRDVKPENLLVTADGRVKLTDFAIAAIVDAEVERRRLTPPEMVVGTPAYMSPEQATGGRIGPWTDLYAVGCLAFELLTGELPLHDPSSYVGTLLRRINEPTPSVLARAPSIDAALAAWVEQMLATDAGQRPATAQAAWALLAPIADDVLGTGWRAEAALPERPAAARPSAPEEEEAASDYATVDPLDLRDYPAPPRAGWSSPRDRPTPVALERVVPAAPPVGIPAGPPALRTCESCGQENPVDKDFCDCGDYLRWEPTAFVQAITPEMAAAATPAPPAPSPPELTTPPPFDIATDPPAVPPLPPPIPFGMPSEEPEPPEPPPPPPPPAEPLRRRHLPPSRALLWARARGAIVSPAPRPTDEPADLVECSVCGPRRAGRSQTIELDVLLRAVTRPPRPRARAVNRLSALATPIPRGSRVGVDLLMPGVRIDRPHWSAVWDGRPSTARLALTVPLSEHAAGPSIGTVVIRRDGWPVGHIRFRLDLVAAPTDASVTVLGDASACYRRAFLSFAEPDGATVRERADAMRRAGLEFPPESVELPPSERWARRLYPQIDACDVFLLFWSQRAPQSWWLRREVERVLELRRVDPLNAPEIVPVRLDGTPGWPELAHLHLDAAA